MIVNHYKQGKDYGYPTCCIITFYVRYYTTSIIAEWIATHLKFIINTEHEASPSVKCPYHYMKSLLQGKTKYVIYKVLLDNI